MTLAALPHLLMSFPDPVLAFDADERVAGWNPAAERVYGLPADDAVGTNVWMLVPRTRQRPFARALAAVRRHGHWAGELVTLGASGAVRLVDARWSCHDGLIVAVHAEVGDRRRQELADRRADRWTAVRALAGAVADVLPAGPVREVLGRTGHGSDPAADRVYHGTGAWVLVAAADPLVRELARAVLDAAGYSVVTASDRSAAGRESAAHRDRLRAAVLGFGHGTAAVVRELHRYRALLPVVSLADGFDPAELLRRVAEVVGDDRLLDPESDLV